MPIEKSLTQPPMGLALIDNNEPEIEVEVVTDDDLDDGMTIDLSGEKEVPAAMKANLPHDANLAEYMTEDELLAVIGTLSEDVETDKRSRSEWEETYKKGLELLGLKIEERTEPWEGACGIVHPLLAESCMRFQAETITETFPAQGPAKYKIHGLVTKEKEEQAKRVVGDMNYEMTDVMTEYRAEHERVLWNLPIAGSALKKVYFDSRLGRQTSMFVDAKDFIVAYGTTDLYTSPRYTHRFRITPNDVRKFQEAKFYRDVDLGDPVDDIDDVTEEKDKINGQDNTIKAEFHTFHETYVDLSIPGFPETGDVALPYIVTYDRHTDKVLSIYRNWEENDPLRLRKQHFSHYQYVPGFGFYGLGLVHLVGGFAMGATSIIRQLVDAGTLSNLPGGLKTKGLRIRGDEDPIAPGEWRDVDVPSGTLKENLHPLPYKEPSVVLFQLLEKIVEEGRKFAAVAEMKVSDFDANSPVGTTMALLERTLKVMSAVQARVYAAMKMELRMIKDLIAKYGQAEYRYMPDSGDPSTRKADYQAVDVIPVADPNSATMSQRIVQWQAVMQLAQMAPQIYDLPELHAQMLEILGIKNVDKMIPSRSQKPVQQDPVTENMNIMTGKPVKAFLTQDHKAHIAVHQAAMQDPKIMEMMGQNPMAQQIQAAAMAHLMEHMAYAYRQQIEESLGTQLPPEGQPLPPEIEVQISGLLAVAAPKVLGINKEEQAAKQAEMAQQDPVAQAQLIDSQVKLAQTQIKADELELKKQEFGHKVEESEKKLALQKHQIDTQAAVQGANIGATAAAKNADRQLKAVELIQGAEESEKQRQHDSDKQERQHGQEAQKAVFDLGAKALDTVASQRHDIAKQAHEHASKSEESDKNRMHASEQADKAAKAKPTADKKKGAKK